MEGCIQVGSQVVASTNVSKVHTIKELNIMHPKQVPISGNPPTLYAGQVGVVVANIHDNEDISVGDVLCFNDEEGVRLLKEESKTKMLKANPMVYASIYPCDKSDFSNLQKSLQKLLLNDSSVHTQKEIHPALGNGFKLGFLGLLHMEVFSQRLDDEFDAQVMITAPSVPYKGKSVFSSLWQTVSVSISLCFSENSRRKEFEAVRRRGVVDYQRHPNANAADYQDVLRADGKGNHHHSGPVPQLGDAAMPRATR